MIDSDPRGELTAALHRLAELAESLGAALAGSTAADGARHRLTAAVTELLRRLDSDRLRVLVVGESKRGKSTLTNALIGLPVLPTGVTPLTAVPTTVTYGRPDRVTVTLADGTTRTHPLPALPSLVTEDGNPGNRLGLTGVVAQLDAPLLADGVELVDTPGTGSVNEANTAEAEAAYGSMDAAIFVVTADPPISAAERALLRRILRSSAATFVVLNKADRLNAGELATTLEFTRRVVRDAAGADLPVYACSAQQALTAAACCLPRSGDMPPGSHSNSWRPSRSSCVPPRCAAARTRGTWSCSATTWLLRSEGNRMPPIWSAASLEGSWPH